jgi:hypothetical protein
MSQQENFFVAISDAWPALLPRFDELLRDKWRATSRQLARPRPLEFRVSSISIPKAEWGSGDWEISFHPTCSEELMTIHMRGLEPAAVVVDD